MTSGSLWNYNRDEIKNDENKMMLMKIWQITTKQRQVNLSSKRQK